MERVAASTRGVEASREVRTVRVERDPHVGQGAFGEREAQQQRIVARVVAEQRKRVARAVVVQEKIAVSRAQVGVARIELESGLEMCVRVAGITTPCGDLRRERQCPCANRRWIVRSRERLHQRAIRVVGFAGKARGRSDA